MANLEKYRAIVENLLRDYACLSPSRGEVQDQTVFDREGDHYLLLRQGWSERRIHHCILHLDIIEGKVWIQCNNTDQDIAQELVQAGIPREQIVLGLQRPELRQFTEYAVA